MEKATNIRTMLGLPSKLGTRETLSLFGLSLMHAWIYAFNTSAGASAQSQAPWQFIYLAIAATMIGLAVASRTHAEAACSKIGCAIAAVAGIAASLTPLATGMSQAAALASVLLAGLFVGWSYSLWAHIYARFSTTQAVLFLFGSGIVAALLKAALFFIPMPALSLVLAAAAPLAMHAGLTACSCTDERAHGALRFTTKDAGALWKVAALIVVFSIVNANLIDNEQVRPAVMPAAAFLFARACEIVLCACVIAWVFGLKKPFDFVQLWRIILVILASDILVRIALPGIWLQPIFSTVCVNFIVLFVWLTLSDIAHHSDMSPAVVFGIGWSMYTLPLFIGVTFTQATGSHATESLYLAALMYVVLIVSTFCLELRDRDMQLIFSDVNAIAAPAPSEFTDIDARCKAIAEAKHLTARELEVMQMLCKGRTKAYIAESMFVTENTVKGHTKRLYAKLNVHSKKELQQLIDLQ